MTETLERLAAAGIQLLPAFEIPTHYVLERDGFIALVERMPDGFGKIGSPGLLTPNGFAVLVWRGKEAFFVGKGFEQPAETAQVEMLRRFSADLERALGA